MLTKKQAKNSGFVHCVKGIQTPKPPSDRCGSVQHILSLMRLNFRLFPPRNSLTLAAQGIKRYSLDKKMGNKDHMSIALSSSVSEWNEWRSDNLRVQPDLTRIDLSGRDLTGIDFRGVGLFKANLSGCVLHDAILRQSIMIESNITKADLTGAHVYGVSAWDMISDGSKQNDLVVTKPKAPVVTCDNIEVAQFIHLLISNPKIRDVIDGITSKSVLILGRFTPPRKRVLDLIRAELRLQNLLPVVFDFEGPDNRDVTDTVRILAQMSRAVIADVSDPASSPYELMTVVPIIQSPVFPIIETPQRPFSMMNDLRRYPWFKETATYKSEDDLVQTVIPNILKEIKNV